MQSESIVPKGSRHHSAQRRVSNAGAVCGWVGKKCGTDGAFSPWRSCDLMDEALVFGAKDCRIESCQDQNVPHLPHWIPNVCVLSMVVLWPNG